MLDDIILNDLFLFNLFDIGLIVISHMLDLPIYAL